MYLEIFEFCSKDPKTTFNLYASARNAKGYDACFVIKEMLRDPSCWNHKIVRNGIKLVSITSGNLKSLKFKISKLSKLPSAFNIKGSKGTFPHFFNTIVGQEYVGDMPPKEINGYKSFNVKNFDIGTYDKEVNRKSIFNFKVEIVKYYKEANILQKACITFRNDF